MSIEKIRFLLEVLKEEEENKEESGQNKINLDDKQHLNNTTLARVGKMLAKKIDGQIPDEIEEKDIKTNLGIIDFSTLKRLSAKNIAGLKINPVNTQDDQQVGATPKDVTRFEKPQLVPFFLLNKEGETVSGSKSGKSFYICFWIPAIGIPIDKDNIQLHSEIFDLDKPKEGMTYKHVEIISFPFHSMDEEMLPKIQRDLKTGAWLNMFRLIKQNAGGKKKSTGSNESVGEDDQSNTAKETASEETK